MFYLQFLLKHYILLYKEDQKIFKGIIYDFKEKRNTVFSEKIYLY